MEIIDTYLNQPTKDPDFVNKGRAWRLPKTNGGNPYIGEWLVDTKGFGHPVWWWYGVVLIHLRDEPGLDKPQLHFPEATHELVFGALQPNMALPDVDRPLIPYFSPLNPIDLVQQFVVPNDQIAEQLAIMIVKCICEGNSPDQDFRNFWYGTITQTAEHLTYGCHPSDN